MSFLPSLPIKHIFKPNLEGLKDKKRDNQPKQEVDPERYYKKIIVVREKPGPEKITEKSNFSIYNFHFYLTQYDKIIEGRDLKFPCEEDKYKNAIVIRTNTNIDGHTKNVMNRLIRDVRLKQKANLPVKIIIEYEENTVNPEAYYKKIQIVLLPPSGYKIEYSPFLLNNNFNDGFSIYHYHINSNGSVENTRPHELSSIVKKNAIVIKIEIEGILKNEDMSDIEKYSFVITKLKKLCKELKKEYKIKKENIFYQNFILSPTSRGNSGLSDKAQEYANDIKSYAQNQIARLSTTNSLDTKITDFRTVLDEIKILENSNQYYDITEQGNLASVFDVETTNGNSVAGVATYDFYKNKIVLYFDKNQFGLAEKAHEFKHLYQFEVGELDIGNYKAGGNPGYFNDIFIEREANERAKLYGTATHSEEKGAHNPLNTNNLQRGLIDIYNGYLGLQNSSEEATSYAFRYKNKTYIAWQPTEIF